MTKLKKMDRADGKKHINIIYFVLCVAILKTIIPTVALAAEPAQTADAVIDVSTVAGLRTALENDAGSSYQADKEYHLHQGKRSRRGWWRLPRRRTIT